MLLNVNHCFTDMLDLNDRFIMTNITNLADTADSLTIPIYFCCNYYQLVNISIIMILINNVTDITDAVNS